MKKGMSGKVMTIIISLIVAFIALAILFLVLTDMTKYITIAVEKIVIGMKCWFCNTIGILKNIAPMCGEC